jgi:hypothetical protein
MNPRILDQPIDMRVSYSNLPVETSRKTKT